MSWSSIYELENKCLIGIPKKGRLYDKIQPLLTSIDVQYVRKQRLDIPVCTSLENTVLVFLPAHDIALYTSLGRVDMGITGLDIVHETNAPVNVVSKLGFGKCRLAVQVPQKNGIKDVKSLIGKRIATSFPHSTKLYFDSLDPNHKTVIETLSGSVEVACALGLADAVVDLVETGETMRAAGLEELVTIIESEAAFIINPHSKHKAMAEKIAKRIEGVLTAQLYIMVEYNLERSKLPQAKLITPGKTSPTVSPLDNPDLVAVKVMVPKQDSNKVLDELEAIGAKDIVVCVLTNCRS